jgi:hypothetical protein
MRHFVDTDIKTFGQEKQETGQDTPEKVVDIDIAIC